MFEIKLDFSDFERLARRLGDAADQVPFALSQALNDAARETRDYLIEDSWPRQIQVRNQRFLGWALRTEWASKNDLSVSITDARAQGRGNLKAHALGGIHRDRAAGQTAVPVKAVAARRTGQGVPKSLRPKALSNKVVLNLRGRGQAVFQRVEPKGRKFKRQRGPKGKFIPTGGKRVSHLKLMYVLKPSTRINKDVAFYEDFATKMREEVLARFPGAMREAMRSRR